MNVTAFKNYSLLDSGNLRKLEQVGGSHSIIRPAPQAVWAPSRPDLWQDIDAEFKRFSGGDGKWFIKNKRVNKLNPAIWKQIHFQLRLTDFGHLGIFAEQASNWKKLYETISQESLENYQVLNLFAYTGGSTLACAAAGAQITHVDASKISVSWARDNAAASNLADRPIRWIVEDVNRYVQREIKRGSQYQGIILDPPSFGRGPKNEVWKIDDQISLLLADLRKLVAENFRFILLSAHSPGYTPLVLKNLLSQNFSFMNMTFDCGEMVVNCEQGCDLPSGAYCFLKRAQ